MKGQGATEYLVIMAVVLIVALVVIGLLGWFPGIAGSARAQQSATYWQGATPFSIMAFRILNNTGGQLSVTNQLSQKLTLTSITFDNGTNVITPPITFNGGETKLVTISTYASCGGAGTPFEVGIVKFTYPQGTIDGITQTGDKPLVGKCS